MCVCVCVCVCDGTAATGDIHMWGRNSSGQLGIDDDVGDWYSHQPYPRLISSLYNEGIKMSDVACGLAHVVAVARGGGGLYYWGAKVWMQPRQVPVDAKNTPEHVFEKVAAGGAKKVFSFALTGDGRLYTWGNPRSGCMIRETHWNDRNEPAPVDPAVFDGQKVVAVTAGGPRCLAVTEADESE
eukprot:GHVU01134339.1.p2 GENE.GHVU01134339.1~~GHVU01134339.1.p2  ORF type:complete len:184 (+),score=27.95 GHVU01134339.1:65-616(+)